MTTRQFLLHTYRAEFFAAGSLLSHLRRPPPFPPRRNPLFCFVNLSRLMINKQKNATKCDALLCCNKLTEAVNKEKTSCTHHPFYACRPAKQTNWKIKKTGPWRNRHVRERVHVTRHRRRHGAAHCRRSGQIARSSGQRNAIENWLREPPISPLPSFPTCVRKSLVLCLLTTYLRLLRC